MKLDEYCKQIELWLENKLKETNCSGYVLGISGGIDSALVAAIAKNAVGKKLFGFILPCESHEEDANDAITLLKQFDIDYTTVDLTETYHVLKENLIKQAKEANFELTPMSLANVKVRLRMVTLYAFAQARNSLVLGTDNMDESYTGYFTKYGDGGVDLLPIVHLTKGEVYLASKLYNVPQVILDRQPSAGLFEGQTDEGEMGVSYNELDRYLLGDKTINPKKIERIEHLHKVSEHKRTPIPSPNKFERE